MKIQEMSFMLLALVLFFIIAGLFFISVSNANLKNNYENLAKEKAITTAAKLSETPELSCGERLCVDIDKVLALKDNPAFSNFWDVNGLAIRKLYPSINNTNSNEEIECNTGNYDSCNIITLKEPNSNFIEVRSYTALCKKESKDGYSYDKCELGVISAFTEEGKA